MILSDATQSLFKQLGGINNSVMLKKGKKQVSMTEDQNVLGTTTIAEEIPADFGVFSMSQFLGNFSYIKGAELEFDGNVATFKGDITQKFAGCSPKAIKLPPEAGLASLEKTEGTVKFDLGQDVFNRILKLAANNLSTHIFFVGNKKDGLAIRAAAGKDDAHGTKFKLEGKYEGDAFEQAVKLEHLSLIASDNYGIELIFRGSGGTLKMKSKTKDFTYYINFAALK